MLRARVHRLICVVGFFAAPCAFRPEGFAAEIDPATGTMATKRVLNWETDANKSYVIPALEIPVFLVALNLYDREVYGREVYGSTLGTTSDHAPTKSWQFDEDPFNINQFSHPYLGATMHGIARSSGLSFWEALVYSNAGSYAWEVAGERGPPSINDMITTSQAGSLLGESLFRMASLVLEHGGEHPGFWREMGAAILMPPLGFNRLAYGRRFKTVFPSHDPATFWQLRLGASADAKVSDNSATSTVKRQEFILDFSMAYGLPGQPGYTYDRPLDYFQFEFAALSSAHTHNWVENILCRGLLWGKSYGAGDNAAGVAGVYGSYDFISPQIFRVSSTAVSVGTTAQLLLSRHVTLQGSLLTGVGFGGAGTQHFKGERDYHYGITPQGLVALRLIFGERAMFDLTAREYYISGTGSDDKRGTETVFRGNAGIVVRVYGRNALGIQYVASHRDAHYKAFPNKRQTVSTFSLTYTFLSDTRFGAIGSHQ
ncbi:MAG: DUF3943 domain-containing protein [Opitutaceae bacterium]|nr:DUF3943 domain-containing protein [Opitutaceae bacterium]